jgi:hypothetical protein
MSAAIVRIDAPQWDAPDMVRVLKETVCKGATDAQFKMFVEVCKATGLNPLLKEIYFVPNVGVMAGRDGYLRVANEHAMFDGMETLVDRDENGIPIKATCRVWRKDRSHPITTEAYYNEYRKDSQVWRTYKSAMIGKVAEVLALKRSFSINGVVTEEEIGMDKQDAEERQRAYAEITIAENNQRRIAAGQSPITEVNPPADYEQRYTALVMEANEMLDQAKPSAPEAPKPRKAASKPKGSVSFEGLKAIGEMKDELRKLLGTDERYYDILGTGFGGTQHANELSADDSRRFYKALAAERKTIAEKRELENLLGEYMQALGLERFHAILGANGCETVSQALELNGTALTSLLGELRAG